LEAAEQAGRSLAQPVGGVCACATCHVYLTDGLDALSEMDECEADNLDKALTCAATHAWLARARLQAEQTYVVRISSASRQTFFDEHPELRQR